MRRMRDPILGFLLVALIAIGLHYGLNYFRQLGSLETPAPPQSQDMPELVKPSDFKEVTIQRPKTKQKTSGDRWHPGKPRDLDGDPNLQMHEEFYKESFDDAALAKKAARGLAGNVCDSMEFGGSSPDRLKLTDKQWARISSQFHYSRGALLKWLENHRIDLSTETYKTMKQRMEKVKIQRPPSSQWPDLAWRGIGVWGLDSQALPQIYVGGGFIHWIEKDKKRAQFEMTRLLAQTWSPCELARLELKGPWASLLDCLDVKEKKACERGSYSEGGWAVSSALAALLSPPKCGIPALGPVVRDRCLSHMKLSALDSGDRNPAAQTPALAADPEGVSR